ncbi:17228_t:CDS:2, partial [Funneliformis caledonium]
YDDNLKDYFEVDNGFSHYNSIDNEPVKNDNAASIIEKLCKATRKYYQEHASREVHKLRYIGNSSHTKRRKNQQQREAAKGTLTLHTFWNTKKSEEIDEEPTEETNVKESDDEIEDCDWHNKIQVALKNLILDLKKEKVNSEIWIRLNSIQLYLQLIKSNYLKMNTSEIVANAAGKGVYHTRCIHSWANDYIMTHKIPYSRRGYHAKMPIFSGDNLEEVTWLGDNVQPLILVTHDK